MCENGETDDNTNKKSIKRVLNEMSTKSRIKLIVRVLIIIYCVSCLLLQTTQLTIQYFERQSVVNVQIETLKYNKIPALTLCYPRFLSMENVLKKFPELKVKYNEIQDNRKNGSTDEKLSKFYESLTYFVENSDLSIDELLELSLPFEFKMNSCLKPIVIKVKGIRRLTNGSLNEFELQDMEPITSMVFPNGHQGHKCFTFFHHLNKRMKKFQMDVKDITIEIYHKEEWFPLEVYDESSMISFSMHSPNSFPQQMNVNNFLRLKAGKEYDLTYNRWKTVLLPPPFQTNCRDYDMNDFKGTPMRSDCVNSCIQSKLKQMCSELLVNYSPNIKNSTDIFFRSDALRRKDYTIDSINSSVKICPKFSGFPEKTSTEKQIEYSVIKFCIVSNERHLNSECQTICQPECTNRFYNYDVKTNIKHDFTKWYNENGNMIVSITIAHNQMPDQITEHIPEMTFTTFAASFGGLLGMWMGLSALAILQYILKIL